MKERDSCVNKSPQGVNSWRRLPALIGGAYHRILLSLCHHCSQIILSIPLFLCLHNPSLLCFSAFSSLLFSVYLTIRWQLPQPKVHWRCRGVHWQCLCRVTDVTVHYRTNITCTLREETSAMVISSCVCVCVCTVVSLYVCSFLLLANLPLEKCTHRVSAYRAAFHSFLIIMVQMTSLISPFRALFSSRKFFISRRNVCTCYPCF